MVLSLIRRCHLSLAYLAQAYTGSEVLVVFDPDFKFGQNFFVLLTEEAKNEFIAVC
jgi:hypothetical protein